MAIQLRRRPGDASFYSLKATLSRLGIGERALQLLVNREVLSRYRWAGRSYFKTAKVDRLWLKGIPDKRYKSGRRPV